MVKYDKTQSMLDMSIEEWRKIYKSLSDEECKQLDKLSKINDGIYCKDIDSPTRSLQAALKKYEQSKG